MRRLSVGVGLVGVLLAGGLAWWCFGQAGEPTPDVEAVAPELEQSEVGPEADRLRRIPRGGPTQGGPSAEERAELTVVRADKFLDRLATETALRADQRTALKSALVDEWTAADALLDGGRGRGPAPDVHSQLTALKAETDRRTAEILGADQLEVYTILRAPQP